MNNGLIWLCIFMVLGGFGMGFIGAYFGNIERDDFNDKVIKALRRRVENLSRENRRLRMLLDSTQHHGGYNPPLKFDFSRSSNNGKKTNN